MHWSKEYENIYAVSLYWDGKVYFIKILSLFMTISLILITTLEHHKLNDFSDLELTLFAFIEMTLGGAVLLFGK